MPFVCVSRSRFLTLTFCHMEMDSILNGIVATRAV
jgi:hypothetical protein